MTQRYQSSPGNGLFGTSIRPQATPDYSGLIDSIVGAFATTKEGIARRAVLQQQAALAQRAADREDQQLQLQQQDRALREQEYIGKLQETHNEVDPNAPNIGADGKPLSLVRVGNRAFTVDPARTKEGMAAAAKADRVKVLGSLGSDLKPADIEVLANNQPAYDAYVSAHYGPSSQKETPEQKVASAVAIAKATKGIPTYADLHPKAGESTQIVQGNDGQGNPVFYRIPKQGPVGAIDGVTPKTAAGSAGGGQGAQTPVTDMQERYKEIEQHALDLAAGKWKVTPAMQMREGMTYGIARENAAGKAPVGKQIGAQVMDAVGAGAGKDFPRYQALMNSTRALGDDVAKVFKGRQNEESVLREVALAQLTPDDYRNPQVVKQKLSRLQNVIHLAELNNPQQVTGSSGGAPAAGGNPFSDLIPAKKGKK